MDKCTKTAAIYIALLRAIYIINQQNHWCSTGAAFYSSHLLFKRIYEKAQDNIDLAAEKFIGLFGESVVDYKLQSMLLSKILSKYSSNSMFEQSLAIERDFLKYSKKAYDCFEQESKLSLGLDDMIMSIASDREESIYLLQQSTKN